MPWDTGAAEYPKHELRAVWLTTLGGLDWPKTPATSEGGRQRQQRELCDILDSLKLCNINTVLLQTRVRGSVLYPSDIEPWDVALTGQYDNSPGYDPLAFAIEEAHRRGMELHAWVVAVPAFKTEVAGKMGGRGLLSTHPSLLKKHNGMYYLDPGEPETATYIAAICKELTENYDIDGIHLDYIRYPENAATFPDQATYSKYGAGKDKAQWRRDNVTRVVREIYHTVKELKPWVKVSCSPVGKHSDLRRYSSRGWNARDAVYQNAQEWLREGIMDALAPMMYYSGDNYYPFVEDWGESSYGRHVAPGLGAYLLSPAEQDWKLQTMTAELHHTRVCGMAGQCYFRTEFLLANHKGIYDYLRNTFYAYPALAPPCAWLDSIAPTMPSGCVATDLTAQLTELTWMPSTDNLQQGGVRYNVYASRDYPVDTERAENMVATNLPEARFTYNRSLGMNIAITATDRCGNESEPLQLGGGRGTPFRCYEPSIRYVPLLPSVRRSGVWRE